MKRAIFFLIFIFFIGCGGGGNNDSFVSNEDNGSTILNLPLLSEFRISGGVHEIAYFDNFIFYANSNGFGIIDINNLKNIQEISHIDILNGEYTPYDIAISKDGKKAYVVGALFSYFTRKYNPYLFLSIIDISDRYNPASLGSLILESIGWSVKLSKDETKAFIAAGSEFSKKYPKDILVVDIKDVFNPKLINSVLLDYIPFDLAFDKKRDIIYAAESAGGIESVFVGDVLKPKIINSFKFGESVNNLKISKDGEKLFFSLAKKKIAVGSLKGDKLLLLSSLNIIGIDKISNLALSNNEKKVFIAGLKSGLFVVDVKNLSNPKIIALSKLAGSVNKIIVIEDKDIAVIANGERGLQIVDISSLSSAKF